MENKLSKRVKELERNVAQADRVISANQEKLRENQLQIKQIEDQLKEQVTVARQRVEGISSVMRELAKDTAAASNERQANLKLIELLRETLNDATEEAA